jgi:glycosidase
MSKNKFLLREKDWRNGAIVYQVLVDRFSPSKKLEDKKSFYQYPRTLKTWDQKPEPGTFVKEAKYWSHELDFWGGDIQSVIDQLDYLKFLNIDCLYLNPIHESLSNHKYDAKDYLKISPEFGNFNDLKVLSQKLHDMDKKIMLDGVFNHVGVDNPLFVDAKNEHSTYRDWFDFNPSYPHGVRLWADVASLPELNLENPNVRNYIYQSDDSVIRTYLKQGIDGWRLDVAFDIGYQYLKELTDAAHQEKQDAMVVGEIWNYPEKWLKSIDGVMNFTLREIILRSIKQDITPHIASQMISHMIHDAGIETMLKSWNVLDNHDTPRLNYQLKNKYDQRLAQVMQFTLPGSPNIYYGTELGMEGAGDPVNRAPMRWDLYDQKNEVLIWTKKLIDIHQSERALKVGDYQQIISEKLISYERFTDCVEDTVIILINPSDHDVSDHILIRDSSLMNYSQFNILLGDASDLSFLAGILHVTIKKKSFVILKPQTKPLKSYTPYKRV